MYSRPTKIALPQTDGHSATVIKKNSNIYLDLFSIFNYRTKLKPEWAAAFQVTIFLETKGKRT